MTTNAFRIVRVFDEAIQPGPEFDEYLRKRDASVLKYKDGKEPEVYWGRLLTPGEVREVANHPTDRDQNEAAFRRGLMKVERFIRDDGSRGQWTRPTDHSGKERALTDTDLAENFDEVIVQEIGMVIRQRSFFRRESERWFPLPPTLLSVASALSLRLAAQTLASSQSATTNDAAKEPPGAAPKSSPSGDASTGAIATV